MRSTWLILLVMLGSATGCAMAGNTQAQQLAWERWNACDHFALISLDRIEPDGRLMVTGFETEAAPFAACVRQAAADQARGGAPGGPTAAVLVKLYGCQGGAM